jgi:cell wall-associated NlpC family hydrolase
MSSGTSSDGAGERPLKRAGNGPRTGAVISLLVILAVGAVALVVLTLRPSPTSSTQHFVRTFSDPNGYASSVSAGDPAATATAAAPAAVTRRSAGRTILTMKGGWTSAIGQQIATRAMKWVGTPYSFAGGNASGPTLGVAVDHDSRNDGHIVGFDCSGLVIYALAPYLRLTHYAATQYVEAGEVHPTLDQLLPGDLVFWSKDGTIKGVGHVAVYIGNGNVVQAPESGETVRVTPLNQVESGAIGTTRPLTTV